MAINPIKILEEVLATVVLLVTIDSVEDLGGGSYKLLTENTYYLRTLKKVTIDGTEYQITDFEINEFITVSATSGADVPVTVDSFIAPSPLFFKGNPQMVSAEIVKRIENNEYIWPYIWAVEISSANKTLDPSAAVVATKSFNLFFFDSANPDDWSIDEHYNQDIYPLSNYIDFFFAILKKRKDLFNSDAITWNENNHVNFGDYITDEGHKEKILNDDITGIQVQAEIPFMNPGCKPLKITCKGDPAGVTINTNPIANIPSGGIKAMTFVDQDDNPVPVVDLIDLALTYKGEITFPTAVSTSPLSTGQETTYRTDDDGSRFIAGDYASVTIADISDYYTLVNVNEWGHNKRLTGDGGGYMDEATGLFFDKDGNPTTKALAFPNSILRDYSTRRRWFLNRSGARNWNNAIDLARTDVVGGESGWFLPNKAEYDSLSSNNTKSPTYIDSRLFNWSSFNMWTSTTDKTDTLKAHRYSSINDSYLPQLKTQTNGGAYVKIF